MPRRFVPNTNYPHITADSAISFSNLQSQFGGTHPISLGEFYKGGTLINDSDGLYLKGSSYTPVPASGKISMTDIAIRPFHDEVYVNDGSVEQQVHTFVVPEGAGYTNMRVMIQGAGASGMSGFKRTNGWGYNNNRTYYSPAAGGNGGNFAIANAVAVTGGDVIQIGVGTAGVAPIGYITNAGNAGETGAQGGGVGNGDDAVGSYVRINNVFTQSMAGAKSGQEGQYAQKWYDTRDNTLSAISQPPVPDTVSNTGFDVIYLGGRGGLSHQQQAYAFSPSPISQWRTQNLGLTSSTFAAGGGAAAGYGTPSDPYELNGEGFINSTSAGNAVYATWMTKLYSGVGYHPANWVGGSMSQGIGGRGNNISPDGSRTGSTAIYGGGGGGLATGASGGEQSGGGAFVRLMFYDARAGNGHLDSDGVSQSAKYLLTSTTPWA